MRPAGPHSQSLKLQGQMTALANVWDKGTVTLGFLEAAVFLNEKEQWSWEPGWQGGHRHHHKDQISSWHDSEPTWSLLEEPGQGHSREVVSLLRYEAALTTSGLRWVENRRGGTHEAQKWFGG